MILRALETVAGVTGTGLVLVAQMPGVPDDLQNWPVTAIMGLITLAALGGMILVMRSNQKGLSEAAAAMTKVADAQAQANTLAAEANAKAGAQNQLLTEIRADIKARPCQSDELLKMLRKTQRIRDGE